MSPKWLPPCLGSIRRSVQEQMWLEAFQDGHHSSHLEYQNGTILILLNIYVPLMPPIKFQLNLRYCLGWDVVSRISRWPPWRPLIYQNGKILAILNLCLHNTSHQVLAQSDLPLGSRCHLKIFKMVAIAAILDIGTKLLGNSESLCHCDASHQVSAQSNLRFGRRCHLKNFKIAAMVAILGNGIILAVLNYHVSLMPPTISAQTDLKFWRRCDLKNFRMAFMVAILNIGSERI